MRLHSLLLMLVASIFILSACNANDASRVTVEPKSEGLRTGEPALTVEEPKTAEKIKEIEKSEPTFKEFLILADDNTLNPTEVRVNKGDIVRLIFQVNERNTYFGGLDFRSDVFGDTGQVKPGDQKTVEFRAEDSFTYSSYWPASNRLKATGKVTVNG